MSGRLQRAAAAGVVAVLAAVPVFALARGAGSLDGLLATLGAGFSEAMNAVGWVIVPQLLLACAVGGLAMESILAWLGDWRARSEPPWLDAALESALLLGMLGTLVGMVRGFAGLTPAEIEPGPLLHGLGTALRSSVVGFGIVLVGVWVRSALPEAPAEPGKPGRLPS